MGKNVIVRIAFSMIALMAIFILNQMQGDWLFKQSLKIVPKLQFGASDVEIKWWNFFTYAAFYGGLAPPMVPYISIRERPRTFYYWFVVIMISSMKAIIKLNLHQGRPFWESDEVQPIACSSQYGTPSGHTLSGVGLHLAVWLDFNHLARERGGNIMFGKLH